MMSQLVSTEWLDKNLNKVKILDASWHLPNVERNALEEFKLNHITNSIFFDIDKNSNQNTNLPHMLPSSKDWRNIVSNLGINNSDHIIVYDNSDVFSSCRVWYTFLYFGHDPELISVLDGNFKKWTTENRSTSKGIKKIDKSNYLVNENLQLVLNKNQINKNIINKKFQLIDARGEQRFLGLQREPRKELKSGNIKGSKNLPFQKLINNKEGRTFKKREELINIFKERQILIDQEMVFTCGSGITACILGLANSIISGKKPIIYDGSWAEYGLE
jgi:thiosulfate/3-mercaptopyruvate sulfurtransferase